MNIINMFTKSAPAPASKIESLKATAMSVANEVRSTSERWYSAAQKWAATTSIKIKLMAAKAIIWCAEAMVDLRLKAEAAGTAAKTLLATFWEGCKALFQRVKEWVVRHAIDLYNRACKAWNAMKEWASANAEPATVAAAEA